MTQKTICYARTSSRRNKSNLSHQCKYLKFNYPGTEIVKEVGDGFSYNREGLLYLIKKIKNNEVAEIVAMSKDIISENDYKIFKMFCKKHSCKLIILNNSTSIFKSFHLF